MKAGANVNSTNKLGEVPLYSAAASARSTNVLFLIKAGAHVDFANKLGATPLEAAVLSKDVQTLKALLESGADPRVKASATAGWSTGRTLLDIARQTGTKP